MARERLTADRPVEIRLDKLSREFTEGKLTHRVLDAVTADFFRGESVAIRGRSGSGKSTLLNLISGIDAPDSGHITVAGTDITRLSEHDRTLFRRARIGFVYQAFNLVATLSVADNVRLVLDLNGVSRRDADRRVGELLETVDLADRADSFPDVLSGGEQQRVAIARALSNRPSVLLADEPTGNLDDATAEGVLGLLERLVSESGSTMLVATHSHRVASLCDRELELYGGRLVALHERSAQQ